MAGLYRAGVTSAGFQASRLYELSDDDEDDPRVVQFVECGWLVKQGALPNVHAIEPPDGSGDDRFANGVGPYVEPEVTSRHGVPELPA